MSEAPVVTPSVPAVPPVRRWVATAWASPTVAWCLAAVPYVAAVAVAFRGIVRGHHFGNLLDFLDAARAMRAGRDLYASGTGGYVYPPLIAFLYQPLAALSDRAAAVVVLGAGAALSLFTLAIVSRMLVRRLLDTTDPLLTARAAVIGAACTADKIKGEFSHLETNVLMLLAFTTALKWLDRWPWVAGLALGFAFNIKYLPIVLVPYLLLRGRWRAVGWFAVFAAAFAVLPAASMGMAGDLHAWGQATAGIGRLFGVGGATPTGVVAHVRSIVDPVSISMTSGVARVTGLRPAAAVLVAAVAAGGVAAFTAVAYARNRIPWVRWPVTRLQRARPFAGLLTVEWMALLLMMLALSPFTNSRHLYMLLDVNIAAAVMLLGAGGRVPRWPLAVALVGLWLGITFPPGSTHGFGGADAAWRTVGGPGWCMLGMAVALVWTNARMCRPPAAS